MKYVALLRGINVGGNKMIAMTALKECLGKAGFADVRTYIQSGNVLFTGPRRATAALARKMEAAIEKTFAMDVGVAVFTGDEWQEVVRHAPKWWGREKEWRHNLIALLPGAKPSEVLEALGTLKPDLEQLEPGDSVVYQSVSFESFGRTRSSRLASLPIYRRVTVRNRNTTLKLAELLAD